MVQWFALIGVSFLILGCGVKGRPLPPLEPPQIGDSQVEFNDEVPRAVESDLEDADDDSL